MLESRLQKRLRENEFTDFEDYIQYLFSKEGNQRELQHMVNQVTTNKTDFFREPAHFNFLAEVIVPGFKNENPTRPLNIWSAGCSAGMEAYTICITLFEKFGHNFNVWATDISTKVLNEASQAIYKPDKIQNIALELKQKYFLKSKDKINPTVRVTGTLRRKVNFAYLNLMDQSYNTPHMFDVIFCRNTLIYFDSANQEAIIRRLLKHLKPNGYFFIGHSESVAAYKLPLRAIKPTIYQKTD